MKSSQAVKRVTRRDDPTTKALAAKKFKAGIMADKAAHPPGWVDPASIDVAPFPGLRPQGIPKIPRPLTTKSAPALPFDPASVASIGGAAAAPSGPPADWNNPSSPNYERRNYYVTPDGTIVAREPGYYNPDKPWDTGRPHEVNEEYWQAWDPSWERRMDEPGVTPWGPGQARPGAGGGGVRRDNGIMSLAGAGLPTARGGHPLLTALANSEAGNLSGGFGEGLPQGDALLALLAQIGRRVRRPGNQPHFTAY